MKRFLQTMTIIAVLVCGYGCVASTDDEVTTIKVESVTLDKGSITLTEGESSTLKATISPSDAENKSVKWESSDEEIATVSTDGKVKAISVGTATITVKTVDGGKSASCQVIVKEKAINVESVALDQTAVTITEGESVTLEATVSPNNATNKAVTWSSSNADIASVAEGKITAVAPGTATITVKTVDGEKSATCEVTVKAAILKDVESVSDLTATTNTHADEFYVTWTGVDNASSYKCWYVVEGDDYETPADAIDNGDGSWSAKSSTAMGAAKYTFYVVPIPIEGHGLKSEEPASVIINLPKWENTGFSYRFMSDSIEEGVEYETACYDLTVKYKNIQFRKSDNTQPIADNWYIYTTSPVEDLHHIAIWYSLNYDNDNQSIRVYSSTEPGQKQVQLTPEAKILSGKWKVYYKIPEGHEYIYIEGRNKSHYLLWTSFYMYSWPKAE